MTFTPVLFALLTVLQMTGRAPAQEAYYPSATCTIQARSGIGAVYGNITLQQVGNTVVLNVSLAGFNQTTDPTKHGFHVHQSGNLSGSCAGAQGHFNPAGMDHAGMNDTMRHVGDLGNLVVQADGTARTTIRDTVISLLPNSTNYIVGRAIVVHALEDDLGRGNDTGSKTTGNAGGRLGCCTIVATTTNVTSRSGC